MSSYISANRSLNNRLKEDHSSRRKSSMLLNEILSGTPSNNGIMFDLPPGERQAKFEEWIKLTTDNKINTSNSWAVLLIDYFHDMEVFRDGDNINFQKLSTTLDGCVKVYSSRIDSVITETGKLLSGLATKKDGEEDDQELDENGETDVDGKVENMLNEAGDETGSGKVKKKSDSTLKKWREIKMRSLDQELAIDPLFKKTLAEFDEGGAKSLLMHMLTVDKKVRIIFDTSTAASVDLGLDLALALDLDLEPLLPRRKINVANLKSYLNDSFHDEELEICPSLNQLEAVVHDIEKAKTVLKEINYDTSYNMSVSSRMMQEDDSIGSMNQATLAVLFNDDDGFGDVDAGPDFDDDAGPGPDASGFFASTTVDDNPDETELDNKVLSYFDEQLRSNWAGPVHWKVRALKGSGFDNRVNTLESDSGAGEKHDANHDLQGRLKRLRKEELKIDFFLLEEIQDEDIFTVYKNSKINVNLKEAENFHLLPDDTFFSSKNLIHLFTKEDQTLKLFKVKKQVHNDDEIPQDELPDEKFWAQNYDEEGGAEGNQSFGNGGGLEGGDGIDEDDDDNDEGPLDDGIGGSQLLTGTQQLLAGGTNTKSRRTVNFARVAKRVDLILLKDNIWKSIEKKEKVQEKKEEEELVFGFKDIVKNTVKVYPSEQKKDLSTSFEFIALLHLANEKGFTIETNEDHSNLFIKLALNGGV